MFKVVDMIPVIDKGSLVVGWLTVFDRITRKDLGPWWSGGFDVDSRFVNHLRW